MNNTIIDWV